MSGVAAAAARKVILPEHLRPTYYNGRWHKPVVSRLQLARARKAALLSGQEWTIEEDKKVGGRREKSVKFKGHKWERNALDRAAKIEQAMKEMPKRVEEYYKSYRARRQHDTQLTRIFDSEIPTTSATGTGTGKAPAKKGKKDNKSTSTTTPTPPSSTPSTSNSSVSPSNPTTPTNKKTSTAAPTTPTASSTSSPAGAASSARVRN